MAEEFLAKAAEIKAKSDKHPANETATHEPHTYPPAVGAPKTRGDAT